MLELQKVGTDIELFLWDKARLIPIPVVGMLGGTKKDPKPVPELGEGFAVQEDNVMVEFNVPPAATAAEFANNVNVMVEYLRRLFAPKGLDLVALPSMRFLPESLQSRQAQVFGCEPDFDAWNLVENEIDRSDLSLATLRTAGGHVHVSFTEDGDVPSMEMKIRLARSLDFHLGLPSLLIDKDAMRRKLYGNPGAFRPKSYGIEYRALSNFWAKSPELSAWVFSACVAAIEFCNRGQDADSLLENHRDVPINHFRENFFVPEHWSWLSDTFGTVAPPNQFWE